jgi:hypothetical protein
LGQLGIAVSSLTPLAPSTTYYWKATWGSEFRVIVKDGGMNTTAIGGKTFYNVGMASLKGTYSPSSHYAYLGAPVGRSGTESAIRRGMGSKSQFFGGSQRNSAKLLGDARPQ